MHFACTNDVAVGLESACDNPQFPRIWVTAYNSCTTNRHSCTGSDRGQPIVLVRLLAQSFELRECRERGAARPIMFEEVVREGFVCRVRICVAAVSKCLDRYIRSCKRNFQTGLTSIRTSPSAISPSSSFVRMSRRRIDLSTLASLTRLFTSLGLALSESE